MLIYYFSFIFGLFWLFASYELWFIILHVLMMFKLGFGDGVWFSFFLLLCDGNAFVLIQGKWSG
jgi:hypothetical protein